MKKVPEESAISDTILNTDHNVSFNDFEILVKDSNELKLFIRESVLIWCDERSLKNYMK